MRLRFTILAIIMLACAVALPGQEAPRAEQNKAALPKLHFVYDHPDMPVTHYEIDVDAKGAAHYESKVRGTLKGSSEEGTTRDFVISPATRDHLFELAKATNNLSGEFDYTKHRIAFTGTKTISFTDEHGTNSAKVVWSENQKVMDLIDLFAGISGTLEEEPVLRRLHRFDRLGLNAELAKMERLASSGWLKEINLISGVLKEIVDDGTIMSLARKRAERLLRQASGKET